MSFELHHGDCLERGTRRVLTGDHRRKISESNRKGAFFACEVCGAEFWRKPFAIKNGDTRFCGRNCYFGWQRGRPRSDEFRRKCAQRTGDKNPNWRGGITPVNKLFRQSSQYKEWRDAVFSRDDWTCRRCLARSCRELFVRIEAHHIKPFATYPALRLDVSNGVTLCKPCHDKEPKGREVYGL